MTMSSTVAPINGSKSHDNKDAEARSELVHLVLWLLTFPVFSLGNPTPAVTSDNVMDLLSTTSVARDIWKVAEEIYGRQESTSNKADDIWTALLVLTSTRGRRLSRNGDQSGNVMMSPPCLKALVLSSMLDSFVRDAPKRCVPAILGLEKDTQRALHELMLRRGPLPTPERGAAKKGSRNSTTPSYSGGRSSSHSSKNPSGDVNEASHPSSRMAHSTTKIYGNKSSTKTASPPPPPPPLPTNTKDTASRHRAPTQHSGSSPTKSALRPPKSLSSPYASPSTSTKPPKSSTSSYASPPQRPTFSTPSTDRSPASLGEAATQLFSPGTEESPGKLAKLVLYWKGRHDEAQMKLEQSRSMNEQLQDKINSKENQHRQELLHHHTVAQERMESELDEYRQRQAQLQSQLEAAQQEAANNAAAAEDYRIARDQLEDVGRLHKELNDTNAALNRYKRRVEELQDVQQQLKCEKEAHERDVQEICRLESRVANLEPFRRQVEEYKNRIAQAEFRLTEANEQLQRQHQDNNSTAVDVKGLLKQNTKLKAQCEELGRRLQQNEIASRDSFVSGTVERLTPELHGELERLRSENAQLRHFYDQRQGDAVTGLQQHLDDAQRLGEVYKSHYSTTRTKLTQNEAAMAQVQAELAETQQCLRTTTEELTIRTETAEKTAASLQAELHERSKKLELVCTQLQAEKDRARILELKVDDYQSQLTDTEKLASERLAYWKKAQKEVDDTSSELDAVTKQCKMLLGDLEDQKLRNKELEDLQSRLGKDLQSAQEELEDAHMQNAAHERRIRELESSVSKITESKLKLQEELEREQRAHQESRDESHRSLQATRSVLLSQNKKQVDEIQDNMNRLLEDERRANRRKDEDHKREVTELNTKWKKDYDDMKERFTLNLQQSHHEAVERVESLKKEYQLMLDKREAEHSRDLRRVELEAHDLIEKTKQDAEDERSSLITRGKSMIEETKVKAESERHLMEQDVAELEHRLKNAELERDNIEMLLRSKINNIKDKLNDTSQQNLDLITENEDLSERVKSLEKENRELEEFKDRFIRNRSAGGLDGGQFRVQMERLQREYHAVLEENRNLKKGKKLESVDETDDSLSFYGRGRSTISILRSEYEAQIETLNDEKRSLVMKNAAASTDVQRAEQRAWEREQEVTRLKNEVTSLKLELARLEDKRESWEGTSPEQDNNYSPLLRFDGMDMPRLGSSSSTTTSRLGMGSFDDIDMPRPRSRSPSLTRAMKNRAEHEKVLQSRITSLTGTPPRVPSRPVGLNTSSELGRRTSSEANPSTSSSGLQPGSADKVLSPTHRHDNVFNTRQSQSDLSSHRNDRSFLRGNVQLSQSVTYPFDKQPSMLDTDLSTTTYRTTKKAE